MLVLLLVSYKEKGVATISQLLDFESGLNSLPEHYIGRSSTVIPIAAAIL